MNILKSLSFCGLVVCANSFLSFSQIHPVSTWGIGGTGTANCTSSSARHMGSNELYTCGTFSGTVDLDPDAGTDYVTGINTSGYVTEYNLITGYSWGVTFENASPKKIMHTPDGIYVAGTFTGTSSFGLQNSYMSNGMKDVFLVRLNFSGGTDWVRTFGGTGDDICESMDLGVSSSGLDVIYLTGTFENTVDFNPNSGVFNRSSNGEKDCFVEKINADGSFAWARTFGGDEGDQVRDIDVRNNSAVDDIHLIGDFTDWVDFNPTQGIFYMNTASSSLARAIFVLKLDENGNFAWAKKIDNTTNSGGFPTYGYCVATDAFDGSVYCGGVFQAGVPFDFDPNVGQYIVNGTGAVSNGFLLKLDQNGQFSWVRTFTPNATEAIPHDISVLGGGTRDIYTIGGFIGQADFNPGNDPVAVLYSDGWSSFITRHKSNGDFKWAKNPQPGPGQTSVSFDGWHSIEAFEHGGFSKIWFTGSFYSAVVDMHPELSTELLYNNVFTAGQHDGFVTEWNENLFGKGVRKNMVVIDKGNFSAFYPNPTTGVISLRCVGEGEVSDIVVSNSQGRLVGADIEIQDGSIQIDMSGQTAGIYFVRYVIDDEVRLDRISLVN